MRQNVFARSLAASERTLMPHAPARRVDAGKVELDGAQYLGFTLPFSISQLVWIEALLVGGAEIYRNGATDLEERIYPGARARTAVPTLMIVNAHVARLMLEPWHRDGAGWRILPTVHLAPLQRIRALAWGCRRLLRPAAAGVRRQRAHLQAARGGDQARALGDGRLPGCAHPSILPCLPGSQSVRERAFTPVHQHVQVRFL